MPQKQRVTPENIIEAAFNVLRRDGMEGINARSIAREAKCSTQPVFSCFATLIEIKDEAEKRAVMAFKNALEPSLEANHPLEEGCRAYIRFAMEEPKLFLHLFMKTKLGHELLHGEGKLYSKLQAAVEEKETLRPEQVKALTDFVCTYAHGMAVIQAAGGAKISEKEAFSRLSAMVEAAQQKFI